MTSYIGIIFAIFHYHMARNIDMIIFSCHIVLGYNTLQCESMGAEHQHDTNAYSRCYCCRQKSKNNFYFQLLVENIPSDRRVRYWFVPDDRRQRVKMGIDLFHHVIYFEYSRKTCAPTWRIVY